MKTLKSPLAVLLSVSLAYGQSPDAGIPAVVDSADGGTLVSLDAGQLASDVPTTEQVIVLDAAQARLVRERIVSCEAERDTFRKATLMQPWQVVLIAVGAAVVSGASVAIIYETTKPK